MRRVPGSASIFPTFLIMRPAILPTAFPFPLLFLTSWALAEPPKPHLTLSEREYFIADGVNVIVFSSWYDSNFSDSKISGIELIHHGERTATNGDVRLSPTPEQWDPIPTFGQRRVDRESGRIEAELSYPEYAFEYTLRVEAVDGGAVTIQVHLDEALPVGLEGKAGFHLEFLPSAYFGKSYLMDETSGHFPLAPSSDMTVTGEGVIEATPLAAGTCLVLAPEDPERRVRVESRTGELAIFDGRNKAQNGWFVVRGLIPGGETGIVLEWELAPNGTPGWIRQPVIGYSQVGYHPSHEKIAVIELDAADTPRAQARLLKVSGDGSVEEKLAGEAVEWGIYTRYRYLRFDFSEVREPGLYLLEYGDRRTGAFRIAESIYADIWHPTLDVFFPVQMDHMLVNEAYRVWHGAAHLDDALQAPVNHEHFDLYAQGPTTDTAYQPGEHIPGLNVGGWFDAGDYDIRTQTHYYTVRHLVQTWEEFGVDRDQTLVDRPRRYVDLHHPDGQPDLLQQIEHGAIALLAQHEAVGHAIPGIIVPDLSQYTHLGDALTMTDNLIYDADLEPDESENGRSGAFDDRWAFTSKSTPLNYGSAAALAAAARALAEHRPEFAAKCLETAVDVWNTEQNQEPDLFHHGNTTGGELDDEELTAAAELLLATGDSRYAKRIGELWPTIGRKFHLHAALAVRVLPQMDGAFRERVEERTRRYRAEISGLFEENPYGVPITRGGWAGNGRIVAFSINNFYLHRAFPEIIGQNDVHRGLHYLFGTHPDSNLSFVSAVGSRSKKVAYGMNRADFSFIPGGVVPGVLILPPDFPENKEDWPFLWGQNEYVISVASGYLFLANAAHSLLVASGG